MRKIPAGIVIATAFSLMTLSGLPSAGEDFSLKDLVRKNIEASGGK